MQIIDIYIYPKRYIKNLYIDNFEVWNNNFVNNISLKFNFGEKCINRIDNKDKNYIGIIYIGDEEKMLAQMIK